MRHTSRYPVAPRQTATGRESALLPIRRMCRDGDELRTNALPDKPGLGGQAGLPCGVPELVQNI